MKAEQIVERIQAQCVWNQKTQPLNGPQLSERDQGWNAALEMLNHYITKATQPAQGRAGKEAQP